MNENLLLQNLNNHATITVAQVETQQRYHKLIRRLNGLQPGRRYMITLTVGRECDYTVQELGKVEK
jgi:hypothetical protein